MKFFSMFVGILVSGCVVSSTYGSHFFLKELDLLCRSSLRLRQQSFHAMLPKAIVSLNSMRLMTEDGIKKDIKESYERASRTYDRSIYLQNQVAQSFINHFDDRAVKILLNTLPIRPTILEIGCGTGVATEKFIKKFSHSKFTASDISFEMLEACKKKLANQVQYEVVDGEALSIKENYDLIVSSLCFHLFKDPPSSIAALRRHSRYLALAMPLDGSLGEWSSLCEKFGLKSRLLDFPKKDRLVEAIERSNGNFELVEETVRQDFSHTKDFLEFLRNVGSTKTRSSTPSQRLKTLPLEEPLSVTYNMGYLFVEWRSQS